MTVPDAFAAFALVLLDGGVIDLAELRRLADDEAVATCSRRSRVTWSPREGE